MIGWFEMSISVKLIFQFYTELELFKVAAGTIDPTPTLLGLRCMWINLVGASRNAFLAGIAI